MDSIEDVADPPEREVGKGSSREGGDQVQDSKRKTSYPEAAQARLSELRKRMEIKKIKSDNKRESRKEVEFFIPDGWMD